MQRLHIRDVIAGAIILFLLGLLAGQWLGDRRRAAAPVAGNNAAPAPAGTQATPAPRASVADLRKLSEAFAQIAAQVTPAVVNISSTRIIRGQSYYDPFRDFMTGDGWLRQPDQTSQSLGSGVIVDSHGIVVTNNHNIEGADEIRVSMADSREFVAKVIGRDSLSDTAVLRVPGQDLPVAEWADSNQLQVGEWVLAIGNPFGFNQTVTQGIVSAKGRHDVGVSDFEEFIQTDAAINPGNSGGALVDITGRVVGINTAIFSKTGGYQGIGFAIPSNIAKQNAEQLLKHGRVVRGWIGIIAKQLNSRNAAELGLKSTDGAVVVNLYRDQPAVKGGVRPLDVVVAVNGKRVKSPRDLRLAVASSPIEQVLTLTVIRNGEKAEVRCRVAEHPMQGDEPVPGI